MTQQSAGGQRYKGEVKDLQDIIHLHTGRFYRGDRIHILGKQVTEIPEISQLITIIMRLNQSILNEKSIIHGSCPIAGQR